MKETVNSALRAWIAGMEVGTNFGTSDIAALVSRFKVKEPERQAMCELERLRDTSKSVLFAYMTRYGYCRVPIWQVCGGIGLPDRGRYVRLTEGDPLCHWWECHPSLDERFTSTHRTHELIAAIKSAIAKFEGM